MTVTYNITYIQNIEIVYPTRFKNTIFYREILHIGMLTHNLTRVLFTFFRNHTYPQSILYFPAHVIYVLANNMLDEVGFESRNFQERF